MDKSRTEIGKIGEFGLIERIKSKFSSRNTSTVLGIDDDAAVIETGKMYTLLSTDMLLEGIHFDLSYMPLKHLGYKSVVVNISDIAAMNGTPRQLTVNLGLSNRMSVEAVDELYEGIRAACEQYNVDLVGGDTTASASGLVISISIIGEIEKKKLVRRSTAGNKDIVCVTGDLGAAYLGLLVLEREKKEFIANPEMQPQLEGYDYIVGRQLKPEARTDIIHELDELGIIPTAMIDISDGLASDIMHICSQSGLGVNIYQDEMPYHQKTLEAAMEFKIDVITASMNGGEDYELLFTINQEDHQKLKNHPDIHFIGYMQSKNKGYNLISKGGNVVPLKAQGWDHFGGK
jgi:thiamine-monophosphate kinase